MSELKVNKVSPRSGTGVQLGDSGDTITIPAGATITNNGTANGFGSADTEKVKVSSNDTTAGFLNGKLVAGTNISLTEGSDGGDETLTAAFSGTISTAQIGATQVTGAKLNTDVITGQTAETTVADDDLVLVSDTSASAALKKMTVANLTANAGLSGWSSSSGNLLSSDASKGIYLGVNSATASNLLDDYEEGTWTAGVSGGTFSFTKNTGYYRKVGNLVYVQIYLVINTYTSGLRVNLTGLPFTSKNISSYDGHYPISCTRFGNVHESVLAVYPMVTSGGTTIKCDTMNSAGSTNTSNNVEFFGNNTQVRFGGCYMTD